VWSAEFTTREEALAAELTIEKWSRAKKEALIAGDFTALRLAAKKKDWIGYRKANRVRALTALDTSALSGELLGPNGWQPGD